MKTLTVPVVGVSDGIAPVVTIDVAPADNAPFTVSCESSKAPPDSGPTSTRSSPDISPPTTNVTLLGGVLTVLFRSVRLTELLKSAASIPSPYGPMIAAPVDLKPLPPPIDISLSSNGVLEKKAGMEVASISVNDPEGDAISSFVIKIP